MKADDCFLRHLAQGHDKAITQWRRLIKHRAWLKPARESDTN